MILSEVGMMASDDPGLCSGLVRSNEVRSWTWPFGGLAETFGWSLDCILAGRI